MFCPNCGTELPEGASFCSKCGTKVGARASAPNSVVGGGGANPMPEAPGNPAVPSTAVRTAALPIPAILGAICAVCSLFPWFESPDWLVAGSNIASLAGQDLSIAESYAPWGLFGLGGVVGQLENGGFMNFLCIIAALLWIAALVVLVLGVVDAFSPGTLAMIPVRNLLVIGAVLMVAVGIIVIGFIFYVNASIADAMSEAAAQAQGALDMLGSLLGETPDAAGVMNSLVEGFGVTFWAWLTVGFGIATIVASIVTTRNS